MKKLFSRGKNKHKESNPPSAGSSVENLNNTGEIYDVKPKDLGKIHKAAWLGEVDKVKSLAKKEVDTLDKQKRSALHLAAAGGRDEIVKVLLVNNADTGILDADKKTALYRAVQKGSEACATTLLQKMYSGDVSPPVELFTLAVEKSHVEIAKLLLTDYGAQVNAKNTYEKTPLHVAAGNTDIEMVKLLINKHAMIDELDSDNRTALMVCCQVGSSHGVSILLEHNANTQLTDKNGRTAEDIAEQQKQHECSSLISHYNQEHGIMSPRTAAVEDEPKKLVDTFNASTFGGAAIQESVIDEEDEDNQPLSEKSERELDSWKSDSESVMKAPPKPKINIQQFLDGGQKQKSVPENEERIEVTLDRDENIQDVAVASPDNSEKSPKIPMIVDHRRLFLLTNS